MWKGAVATARPVRPWGRCNVASTSSRRPTVVSRIGYCGSRCSCGIRQTPEMEEDEADAKKQPEAGEDEEGGATAGGRAERRWAKRRPVTVAVRSDIILDTYSIEQREQNVNVSTMLSGSCPL